MLWSKKSFSVPLIPHILIQRVSFITNVDWINAILIYSKKSDFSYECAKWISAKELGPP